MPLPKETQVLVVGAGPVGMAAALPLVKLGLQVVIVDAALESHLGSRSSAVHSHTLENLDTIGLAQSIIDAGIQADVFTYYGTTNKLVEFDLSLLRAETRFPMSVLIPQFEVERIMREKLASSGIKVYRNKSAVDMREAKEASGMEVFFQDGSVVRAQYVIGADGSKSTIRRLSEIEFTHPQTGIPYEDESSLLFYLVLADVELEGPLPEELSRDKLSVYLDNFLLLVPFRSTDKESDSSCSSPSLSPSCSSSLWRMVCSMPATTDVPRTPSLEYFQTLLDTRNPWNRRGHNRITITSIADSSRYKVRSAVASTLFKRFGEEERGGGGCVLLVGDAAHVHSPAGAQGMNLGICDAIAAAHAIRAHSLGQGAIDEGKDNEEGLRAWAEARRERAIRVIGFASRMDFLVKANRGWRKFFRNFICSILFRIPFVRKQGARRLSGLANRMT